MRVSICTLSLAATLLVRADFCAAHDRRTHHISNAPALKPRPEEHLHRLPPIPKGVTDLKFSEFFVYPVGDRGLTLTPKFVSLNGKRVRILGCMVRQSQPAPGVFLLSPIPVQTHEEEYGLCDDLPPATVHVLVPTKRDQVVPYTPGLLLLTGTLQIGTRVEKDGRNSFARLLLDRPLEKRKSAPASIGRGAEKLMGFPKQ